MKLFSNRNKDDIGKSVIKARDNKNNEIDYLNGI